MNTLFSIYQNLLILNFHDLCFSYEKKQCHSCVRARVCQAWCPVVPVAKHMWLHKSQPVLCCRLQLATVSTRGGGALVCPNVSCREGQVALPWVMVRSWRGCSRCFCHLQCPAWQEQEEQDKAKCKWGVIAVSCEELFQPALAGSH